jgi:hypothetical protein
MTVSEAVRAFLSENGKKGGATNKKKGSAYFKYVVSHRKNMQKKEVKQV